MLVVLPLDAKNADRGQVAVKATEVICVSQWENSVRIFFKGDDDPVIISNSTTAEVVAVLQPHLL